ncbi:MAG TPA: N-acetyl-gamma-glutamyl-phosphate reductase, partial [Solirubrobacteraceae bacterium]|nr:N-acetyl-gamma-glutamyl-phosphate reductase [Solirubrobacteraceae bacterium]
MPSVLIAGASGYAGALAARLIDRHPTFELAAITSRGDAGRRLSELYPHHRVAMVLEELDLDRHAAADAAIVAYPHGASAPLVAALLERGVRVVDLSADFRLRDLATYERWYVSHAHPDLLERAVYGLTELHREEIAGADLVACPGCFPTAAILALAPLAQAGLIADVVIDAKTGVSGAGRGLREDTQFVAVAENVRPYGVGEHRHMPEIDQELAALGAPVTAAFTPHLLPLDQGELLSCYVTPSRSVAGGEREALYASYYADEP